MSKTAVSSERAAKAALSKRNWNKFRKNPLAVIGLILTVFIILACIAAPLLTSADPNLVNLPEREMKPCAEHIFGTDRMGRDIFARVLYGGRTSIAIGIICAVGCNILGTALGCIAGFIGGRTDRIIVVISEFMSIFPQTLMVMLVGAFIGKGVVPMCIIFIAFSWTGAMRVLRSRIQSLKQEPFIESCVANGVSKTSIMFHHMLPNTYGPVLINMTMNVAGFILSEAGLSYIGFGVPETIPTWGNILNAAKRMDIITNVPMIWLAPGLTLGIFILGINFFGDGLRDVLDSSTI